jgi:hypothetical protein
MLIMSWLFCNAELAKYVDWAIKTGNDWKPFGDICSHKFPGEDWAKISAELCSECQEKLKNPHWHPFKKVMENGEPQVCSYTYTF